MKTKILLVTILLGLYACTSNNNSQLSEVEKEKIFQEIDLIFNSISEGRKELNVNKAFKESFSDSPSFKFIDVSGKIMNYNDFFNDVNRIYKSLSKAEFEFYDKTINVINHEFAIVSYKYTATFFFDNFKMKYPDIGSTFVFNKIDNKWKVIHYHESVQSNKFIRTKIE